MKITFVVRDDKTRNWLGNEAYNSYTMETKERSLKIVSIGDLNFYPRELADCYVFETDDASFPWVMSLGRYLPIRCDWTTSTEILKRTGFESKEILHRDSDYYNDKLRVALKLLLEGKVVPFESFGVTWLSMRRHYSTLFSQEACKLVGCSEERKTRILKVLRADLESRYTDSRSYHRDVSPENCVTIAEFVASRPLKNFPGIGDGSSKTIRDILDLYKLKIFAE